MGYGIEEKKVPFWVKLRSKFWYGLIHFPMNKVRRFALRKFCNDVGKDVCMGHNITIVAVFGDERCKLHVGDRVSIASNVILLLASDANWSNLTKIYKPVRDIIRIEDDCWIGAGAIIMPGVTIGKSSVIGAGCVVTKDIPPYSVAVGVPAKVVKEIEHI